MNRIYILGLFVITSFSVFSQDLTGKWLASPSENNGFYGELYLTKYEGKYLGYTYDEEAGGFCEYLLIGKFKRGKLTAKNTKEIDKSSNHAPGKYSLHYRRRGKNEVLRGSIKTGGLKLGFNMGIGSGVFGNVFMKDLNPGRALVYRKVSDNLNDLPGSAIKFFEFLNQNDEVNKRPKKKQIPEIVVVTPEPIPIPIPFPSKKPEPILTPELDSVTLKKDKVIKAREARITKTIDAIKVKSTKIKLHIYDSKQEDNDRITIFLNNKILVENMEVKKKYHEIEINLPINRKINTLTFFANNLGTKPPNTANLRIIIGTERKHYVMSTNLLENSAINFDMEGVLKN